jgi:hypothetical protein
MMTRKRGTAVGKYVALGAVLACLAPIVVSCGGIPTPQLVVGGGGTESDVPALSFVDPNGDFTVNQGDRFTIRWTDSDRDSNARISFSLVDPTSSEVYLLVSNIEENDATGPDSFSVSTLLVPVGNYNLVGVISDSVNLPVSVFAPVAGTTTRLVVSIAPTGQGPQTVPPVVTVTAPQFNQSVAQDDEILVSIQPTLQAPAATRPYDPDSAVTAYLVLDFDTDPTNDDVTNPRLDAQGNPVDIIVLRQQTIGQGAFEVIDFPIQIDLAQIPPRPAGEPYYIRATLSDGPNRPVHAYAAGTISVVQLAAGAVDLAEVGRTLSGAQWYGFNPGANLGSSMAGVGDFDDDGTADFVMVAQFGSPRNLGPYGEAYLVYGLDNGRFGDRLAANSVSKTVSGALFEGPTVRGLGPIQETIDPTTLGITSVASMPDISGDGRNEILFGMPLAYGAIDAVDWDPADEDVTNDPNEVTVTAQFRRGRARVVTSTDPNQPVDSAYNGVFDSTISSLVPNADPENPGDMGILDGGLGNRQWVLLKFEDVLASLPDPVEAIVFESVTAAIRLRVFDESPDQADVFLSITDFDDSTRYSDYAQNGGEPEVGVDYEAGAIAQFAPQPAGFVEINVTGTFQRLLDGALPPGIGDEIPVLIEAGSNNKVGMRSSERLFAGERPELVINYTRRVAVSAVGCYPDNLVNNRTDPGGERPSAYSFAGGMATVFYSENRDNSGPTRVDRLDTTSVALELVGQAATPAALADTAQNDEDLGFDAAEGSRIAGFRLIGGGFDSINHTGLAQGPRLDNFGYTVNSIGDINNDGVPEIIISAPTNERYLDDETDRFGTSTQLATTLFTGSLIVKNGGNFNNPFWRDINGEGETATIPILDHHRVGPVFGNCLVPATPRHILDSGGTIQVYAEDPNDFLFDGQSATDFNLDGVPDILAGAPRNNRSDTLQGTGAVYILYGRPIVADYDLRDADDPRFRSPMLRIRGVKPFDQIGWSQSTGLDVNGDRIADVFFSSPRTDFGGVTRTSCGEDFNNDGVFNNSDLSVASFNGCRTRTGDYVFSDDPCKVFDYDYNHVLNDSDETVFDCLRNGGTDCCANLVENGFVGVIFGGVYIDGDRTLDQLATTELPGVIFYGNAAGHRAGYHISTAGDFNQDGFGDLLIAAPGETRLDSSARERLGVVYLVFGGTHLTNKQWNLSQVGSADLPGAVFLSPYVKGAPNEAAPTTVSFLGDINNDGFGDIGIGNPFADFIDLSFPQGPDAPGGDAEIGRRRDTGDAYIIYGNNFGSNRGG